MSNTDKEHIKELREWAKHNLSQKSVYHKDFDRGITFSMKGIKEYLNQPHKHYYAKNELIKDMGNILKNSEYKGTSDYHKNNRFISSSHIFEITINSDRSWIIAREDVLGNVYFYGVSDSDKVLKGIKKTAINNCRDYNPTRY